LYRGTNRLGEHKGLSSEGRRQVLPNALKGEDEHLVMEAT
jgi:hypothetical protein